MAAKYPIFISCHFDFGQNLKKNKQTNKQKKQTNIFPIEFFNEIWLKVGEREYIYITEIFFFKRLFRFKMAAKTII